MKLMSARDSRAPAPLSTAKRAPAILVAALEVDDAERRARDPSAPAARSRTRAARRARRTSTLSAALLPTGTLACGRFGSVEQRRVALMLDRVELDAELLDLLRARAVGFLDRRRVLALPLGARDLVARRVLLPLQPFDLGNQPAARGLERGDLLERLVGIEPAVAQTGRAPLRCGRGRMQDRACYLGFHSIFASPRVLCYDRAVTSVVRKAVFPAAGLGTRFLPATKAQPKEMLPLVDKPIIQYGVEEAVASGVDNIILVTGRGKNAIEDHFDVSVELETFLEARGKREQLDEVRKISNMINFAYVRQGEPLGLGHAVLVTRELVGDEPFAVILADDVIDADPPAIKQLIDVFERVDGPVLAVERVPRDEISSYGVIAIEPIAHARRRHLPGARPGREAAARRGAVGPGDHRPLHPDAGHLSRRSPRPRATAPARFS